MPLNVYFSLILGCFNVTCNMFCPKTVVMLNSVCMTICVLFYFLCVGTPVRCGVQRSAHAGSNGANDSR